MTQDRETLSLEAIRLLAHPMRQRIERELRNGPVNATALARALGESTGVTSYHLRQLAKYGFVEEIPERARGRERWWRFVPKDRRVPPRDQQSPEMRAVLDELQRQELTVDLTRFIEAQTDDDSAGMLPYSRGSIQVTEEELLRFFEEYIALLYRYKRPPAETPPGARTLNTRFFAYPADPT